VRSALPFGSRLNNLMKQQRFVPWSNTPRAWIERVSFVGMVAAAALLVVYAGDLPPWASILASACLLVVAAVLFRNGWLKAFGPILWYDLVRTSRRSRTYFVRGAYLLILFAVLAMMYWGEWEGRYGRPSNSEIARFAEHFFYTFLTTQFVLMVLLTPAYTAGAIADEKQKKTIQFLLVTDLRSHEIVLGKLGSRMAHLGLLLLAGLPVLGAVQFLGGVDPHLVLAGFAGTAVTLASAAGVSLLASVIARPPRAALLLAYGFILLYVVLCVLGNVVLFYRPTPLALENLIGVIEAGNPIDAVGSIFLSTDPIDVSLPRALGAYSLFHGVVALASVLTASVLLRRASLREPRPPRGKTAPRRPAVGDRAMVWKEVHAERGAAGRWYMLLPVVLLIGGSFLCLLWWILDGDRISFRYDDFTEFWSYWREGWNIWVRVVGTITACLTLLGIAIRAAYSIRAERDRETFDSLLASPLSSEDILYGKWLGAILSVRWMVGLLVFVWGLGVLTGGLRILAALLLVGAWCVYAAAMASLGLWFSLVSRTSARAVLYTILAVVGLSVGHWLLWLPCGFVGWFLGPHWEVAVWIALAEGALTPPVVLGVFLPFGYDDRFVRGYPAAFIVWALAGLAAWIFFTWMVWQATNLRFKRAGGRVDAGAIRYSNPPPHRLS
jgi:ABC-type transport system involved in multi-copper enzyme maturation permease subunit